MTVQQWVSMNDGRSLGLNGTQPQFILLFTPVISWVLCYFIYQIQLEINCFFGIKRTKLFFFIWSLEETPSKQTQLEYLQSFSLTGGGRRPTTGPRSVSRLIQNLRHTHVPTGPRRTGRLIDISGSRRSSTADTTRSRAGLNGVEGGLLSCVVWSRTYWAPEQSPDGGCHFGLCQRTSASAGYCVIYARVRRRSSERYTFNYKILTLHDIIISSWPYKYGQQKQRCNNVTGRGKKHSETLLLVKLCIMNTTMSICVRAKQPWRCSL